MPLSFVFLCVSEVVISNFARFLAISAILLALFSNFKVEFHLQFNHFCLKVRIASLVAQSLVCRLLYRS